MSFAWNPRIPFVLRWARWRVLWVVYLDRLWRDLPLSLTLGGVLSTIAIELFREPSDGSVPVLAVGAPTVLLSLILVPILRGKALSQLERVETIRRLAIDRIDKNVVFFYLLFHLHRAARRTLADAAKRRGSVGRMYDDGEIAVMLEYSRLLAQSTFDLLGFRSVEMMLGFLRFPHDTVSAAVNAYNHALHETSGGGDDRHPGSSGAALRAHRRLAELYQRFLQTVHADLVWKALRVVTMPGTNRAILALDAVLRSLNQAAGLPRQYYSVPSDGSCVRREATILLNLVDEARGISLIDLAGLKMWFDGDCPPDEYKGTLVHDTNSLDVLGHQFTGLLKQELPEWSDSSRADLRVVTTGFSSAVLACLRAVKHRILFAYVVQTDEFHGKDNALMHARILELGLPAFLIQTEELDRQISRQAIELALYGFETINPTGDILHPRSTPHPMTLALRSIERSEVRRPAVVLAVGEKWKVQAFDAEEKDPAFISVYRAEGFDYIVTDHGVHKVGKNLNLSCCMRAATRRSALGTERLS